MAFTTQPAKQGAISPRPSQTTVLGRIVTLLDAVKAAEEPLTVTELAGLTGIPKSSTARLVVDLVERRYLTRTENGLELGMRLFEFGSYSSIPSRMRAAAAPLMKALWDLTGDRVSLWVRQGDAMVLLTATRGRVDFLPTRPGMRTSVFTTASGKASLAFTDREVVDRVCAGVVPDVADDFRTELKTVRSTSVAVDAGRAFPGVRGVATPVLVSGSRAIGAIAVTGPEGLINPVEAGPHLLEAANVLTRRLSVV